MTPAEQIAWHRSEADRIEAEERARRPALAAGQVWRYAEGPETNRFWCILVHVRGELLAVSDRGAVLYDFLFGIPKGFELVGSLARDVLRVVPPDPPEAPPFVAPEGYARISSLDAKEGDEYSENGAVWWTSGGGSCHPRIPAMYHWRRKVQPDPPVPQVAPEPTGAGLVGRDCWVRNSAMPGWQGPFYVTEHDPSGGIKYPFKARGSWWAEAKPYIEGEEP